MRFFRSFDRAAKDIAQFLLKPYPMRILTCSLLILIGGVFQSASAIDRPNILWITSEDNGPQLGCYGDSFSTSPNIDSIAKKGLRFNACWSNAPVCAPARTTIISGMYATSFGASNMRSRGVRPEGTKLLPELLRDAGYYCTNNSKEDYNFNSTSKPWNESSGKAHWRNRPQGTPFFAVFNFTTSHESQIRKRPHVARHDPAKVPVPPYHPDLPEVRQDWAQYYDKIEEMDKQVGGVLKQLEEDGLADSTIVFYFGDHGSGMPRSKRWLYQSGLRVAMIVHVPDRWRNLVGSDYVPGGSSDRLISFVDLVPTALTLAGAEVPSYLQGKAFLGKELDSSPKYIFGFRDRMDERIDMSRAIRNDRYLYIRNFMPHRPQGTYLNYMFQTPTTQVWKKAFDEGKLNDAQSVFWKWKADEELYDIESDPFQIHNLASDPNLQAVKMDLVAGMRSMMIRNRDHGVIPEAIVKAGQIDPTWDWSVLVEAAFDAAPSSSKIPDAKSLNPIVRFWAAQRLLATQIVKNEGSEKSLPAALELMRDPVPSVRIVAAELVAKTGSPTERDAAQALLKDYANPEKHNALISIAALNALANLGKPFGPGLSSLPVSDDRFEGVYQEYTKRLKEYVSTFQ